jgi:hypothetical protein
MEEGEEGKGAKIGKRKGKIREVEVEGKERMRRKRAEDMEKVRVRR